MIIYNVPLMMQTKLMSCWHAAAKMIWAFKYKSSINPLSQLYENDTGITNPEFSTLAQELGFESIKTINLSYSTEGLEQLLRLHGPLWVAGNWSQGDPHVVVITGIDSKGLIHVNDPAFHIEKVYTIEYFNANIGSTAENPIMYLPSHRATAEGLSKYIRSK